MTPSAQAHSKGRVCLPSARGRCLKDVSLARYGWLRAGGAADVLFLPADAEDLACVLASLPPQVAVFVIGVGSNLLVRDGGVRGVVVRLGRGFSGIDIEDDNRIRVGAAALDGVVARAALDAGIGGLEFLDGIPGTMGGALRMNAGAHGSEIADVLVQATALDRQGRRHVFSARDMGFAYRHSAVGADVIFIEALLQGRKRARKTMEARLAKLRTLRAASQPIRAFTGGSTFKNPEGKRKAWQLIAASGCRDMRRGGAMLSPQHCNFLVNDGKASARDIEMLGEDIRARVREKTGVALEWEIVRIGEHDEHGAANAAGAPSDKGGGL